MRLFFKLLAILALSLPAWGQFTTVTASPVQDANGAAYQNGSYSIDLVPSPSGTTTLKLGASALFPQHQVGSLDGSGNLSVTLVDNTQVTPAGSQWRFSICDGTGKFCGQILITISGASQNVQAALAAGLPLLNQVGLAQTVNTLTVNNLLTAKGSGISSISYNNAIFANLEPGSDIGTQVNNACADPLFKGIVIIPGSSFGPNVPITCTGVNNLWITGYGDDTYLDSTLGTLGANPVFNINGNTNLRISNMKIRNGTHRTDIYTSGKDGMDVTNCTNCEFDHLHFNEIEGTYGLNKAGNTNLKEHDNIYDNNTYCDSCNQGGNDGWYVWNNTFNSPTCLADLPVGSHPGNCPQIYSFASGNDATTRAFYSRNGFLWNNKASNAFWECYDAHGGDNINYFDNQGDNCAIGMAYQIAANGNITTPSGIGVHFDHNRINQGTTSATPVAGSSALPNNFGINVQGDGSTGKYTVKGWSEDYNQVNGYGSSPTDSVDSHSALGWAVARDGEVRGNIITNYYQNAIAANTNTQDTLIAGNTIRDMVDYNAAATAAPFRATSSGNYGLIFDRNTVEQNINTLSGGAGLPNIYRFNSVSSFGGVQGLETNIIKANPVTSYISNSNFVPYNQAAAPTNKFIVKMGDKIFNTAFQPGWIVCGVTSGSCSFTDTGYGSFNTVDTVVTVNMTSGANTFTVTGNGTFNAQTCTYLCLPRGANIVIAGAGVAAANLSCKITGVDNSSGTPTVTVYTAAGAPCNASTTVTGAIVTYQGAALWPYQVDGSGNVSANKYTSTVATGTAPLVVASTTNVPNLNASSLNGATFAAPGAIGSTTPAIGLTLGTGGTALALIKKLTDTPGAITVNANTCTDRTVADAGILATATISLSAAYALDAGIIIGPGFADNGGGNAHYRICNVTGVNVTLNAAAAFNLTVTQ